MKEMIIMNLKKILDTYYQKLLKVNGIYISDRMSESDMKEFYRDIWTVGIPLEDVNEIEEEFLKYEYKEEYIYAYKYSCNLMKNTQKTMKNILKS